MSSAQQIGVVTLFCRMLHVLRGVAKKMAHTSGAAANEWHNIAARVNLAPSCLQRQTLFYSEGMELSKSGPGSWSVGFVKADVKPEIRSVRFLTVINRT